MSAVMSPCLTWRYRLERAIADEGPRVAILGVNPSTADAIVNDQTIRKDLGFGRHLGWGRLIKGNLFAFKARDVRELRTALDPVGPANDHHLLSIMVDADVVVAAWGPAAKVPARLRGRWREVVAIAERAGKPLMCFGTTTDGQPCHTLTLAYATPLVPWVAPGR